MLTPSYRSAITAVVGISVMVTIMLNLDRLQKTSVGSIISLRPDAPPPLVPASDGREHLPPSVVTYFDQVFSLNEPYPYDFPALSEHCERTIWTEDQYLHCGGMFAGMTSIMSELKVCLKMAVDTGSSIILPTMPLRDSTDLKDFSIENDDAYMTYDKWFDAKHLIQGLSRACPRMKVLHPDQINPNNTDHVPVKHDWEVDIKTAPDFHLGESHFWKGRPFKRFFDEKLAELQKLPGSEDGEGITVIKVAAIFVLFRITDDPTGDDLRLWNDLGQLLRFLEPPRKIVNNLLGHINRPYYGVHFRVENDTIWSSLEHQLKLDLDALDTAYHMYQQDLFSSGTGSDANPEKPLIYLACGDQNQVNQFVEAGKARGWEVTHKWDIARKGSMKTTLKMINDLPFDFQGAVDMGMMVRSHFFIGISGSAFSSTVANARDVTGRYRGSSLELSDDAGARSHLFIDGGDRWYPCCL